MSRANPNSATRFRILSSCVDGWVGRWTHAPTISGRWSFTLHGVSGCKVQLVRHPASPRRGRRIIGPLPTSKIPTTSFGAGLARSILEGQHVLAFSTQAHLSREWASVVEGDRCRCRGCFSRRKRTARKEIRRSTVQLDDVPCLREGGSDGVRMVSGTLSRKVKACQILLRYVNSPRANPVDVISFQVPRVARPCRVT